MKLACSELDQSLYLETVEIDLRIWSDKLLPAFEEGFFSKGFI
jgi:hypothetical protein